MTETNEPPELRAARDLAPRIRELAPLIESERKLPVELVEQLREAGMFHLFVPHSLGGSETDPVTAARVVEEVAAADGSAGWCVMIAAQCMAMIGTLPDEHAREMCEGREVVAAVARPIGRAIPEGDGYRVSGRWPFASGSSHAGWLGGECTIYDGPEPRKDAQGNAVTRMLFLRRAEVTVHDTWHTHGLRGTASNDFSAEDVYVPAGRGFQMLVDDPVHPWPLFKALPLVFVTHGAQALGVARAAIESAAEVAAAKAGYGENHKLRDETRIQGSFAEATAVADSARAYLYATTQQLWDATLAGDVDTARLRARVRLATTHAARASLAAVELVAAAVGTSALFTTSPLERQLRDVRMAAAHVMVSPLTMEAAGRVELGLDAMFPFF